MQKAVQSKYFPIFKPKATHILYVQVGKANKKNKTMVGIIKGKAFGSHLEVIYGISQYPHHEYAYAQRSTDL